MNGSKTPGSAEDSFVQPESGNAPGGRADELFVHGLMGLLHDKEGQKRRVESALRALAESAGRAEPMQTRRVAGRWRRRLTAALAAVLLATTGVFIFEVAVGNSAYAVVSASLDAAKGSGQHRYEIRLAHWPKDELPTEATGTVDSATPGMFLLTMKAPDGHNVVVGKDAEGEWAIRKEGGIERERARDAWPRWSEVGGESVFADSVENLMENLLGDFKLHADGPQDIPGVTGGKKFDHIHGEPRRKGGGPHARRIDLWIDPQTKMLERLEMTWPQPPVGDKPAAGGSPEGPIDGGAPQQRGGGPEGGAPDAMPDGPRGGSREGPGGPLGGDGAAPGGPDGPREGPGGHPHDGPPGGPDGPPGGPPPRPHGPEGGRPDGHRGPPDGMGGPLEGPRTRPGVQGARGRLALSRVVLTRVDAPVFEDGWFTPIKHTTP